MSPEWNREPTPKTLTRPHRRLMHLLTEMGLQIQTELRVGRYFIDVFCDEVWIGFEADGRHAHAGGVRKAKDAARDEWIRKEAGIPILRLDEQAIRKVVWEDTKELVREFIEGHSKDMQGRKERGRWVLTQ